MKSSKTKIGSIVPSLLDWFAKSARDLPWRRTTDPYAIWVSEIMLQQTQVKTVLGYWERWMRALPTIEALAAAESETIHKLWEGLGYYTRVRNMQKAARVMVAEHCGKFPRAYEAILALPGIGRYTAGAIASIAFNEPRAILDGNVMRVLTRVFGIAEDPREKETNARLWELAQRLVEQAQENSEKQGRGISGRGMGEEKKDEVRGMGVKGIKEEGRGLPQGGSLHLQSFYSSDFSGTCSALNQSLMELGALVCTPKQPKCVECPVNRLCDARRTKRVEELPRLGQRAAVTSRHFVALVVEHRGKFLVRQRPAGVVNAHLWEFPNAEVNSAGHDVRQIAKRELGFVPSNLERLPSLKHSITRYRILLEVYRGTLKSKMEPAMDGANWAGARQLASLPFASAHGKIRDWQCFEAQTSEAAR